MVVQDGAPAVMMNDNDVVVLGDASGADGFLLDAPEPYVGMNFESLLDARNAYNTYAYRFGFSIKANTSRRSAYTKEVEKQQFVCNMYKKPQDEEVDVEKLSNRLYAQY